MSFLEQPARPPLLHAISHIIGVRSEPEVVGANATGVVAGMADEHANRHGAIVYLPRHTMCLEEFLLAVDDSTDRPVPPASVAKRPAPVALGDMLPESFGERAAAVAAFTRAPLAVAWPCRRGRVHHKLRAADRARPTCGGRLSGHCAPPMRDVSPLESSALRGACSIVGEASLILACAQGITWVSWATDGGR